MAGFSHIQCRHFHQNCPNAWQAAAVPPTLGMAQEMAT